MNKLIFSVVIIKSTSHHEPDYFCTEKAVGPIGMLQILTDMEGSEASDNFGSNT